MLLVLQQSNCLTHLFDCYSLQQESYVHFGASLWVKDCVHKSAWISEGVFFDVLVFENYVGLVGLENVAGGPREGHYEVGWVAQDSDHKVHFRLLCGLPGDQQLAIGLRLEGKGPKSEDLREI